MASVRYVGQPPEILFISTLVSNLVIYHFKLLPQCHDNTDLVLKLFEFDLQFAVFVKNQGDCDRSNIKFSWWKAAEDTKEFKNTVFASCHYQSFIFIILLTIQIKNKKTSQFLKVLGLFVQKQLAFRCMLEGRGKTACVWCAWLVYPHKQSTTVKWSLQKSQGRSAAFDLLKYQRGMQDGKQRVESRVSSHVCCSEPLWILHTSTLLKLNVAPGCLRVAGTGHTRQQLPVCSTVASASPLAGGCQHVTWVFICHKQPQQLEFPSKAAWSHPLPR